MKRFSRVFQLWMITFTYKRFQWLGSIGIDHIYELSKHFNVVSCCMVTIQSKLNMMTNYANTIFASLHKMKNKNVNKDFFNPTFREMSQQSYIFKLVNYFIMCSILISHKDLHNRGFMLLFKVK